MFCLSADEFIVGCMMLKVWLLERWDYIKWIGSFLTAMGVVLCISPQMATTSLPFVCGFLGNSIWAIDGWSRRDKPLFALNSFFCVVQLLAVIART